MSWLGATAHLSASPHIRSPHRACLRVAGWLSSFSLAQGLLLFVGHVPSTEVATLLAIEGSGCPPTHPSTQQSTYPASVYPSTKFIHPYTCLGINLFMYTCISYSHPPISLSIHPSSHHPPIPLSFCTYGYSCLHPPTYHPSIR